MNLGAKFFVSSLFSVVLLPSAFGSEKAKHKGHGAHEHGHAKLNLIVEGSKLTAQLEAPSESIYGFEYEPMSEIEKKQREAAGEKLKNTFGKMLVLDESLGCTFANTKLDLHASESEEGAAAGKKAKPSAEHSETHAEFVATCQKPLAGTKAKFAFRKTFPGLKKVKVQLVSESKQSGAEINNDKGEISF